MKYALILAIVLITGTALFFSFGGLSAPTPQLAETPAVHPVVDLYLRRALAAETDSDWQGVLSLLTGEASLFGGDNIGRVQNRSGKLLEHKPLGGIRIDNYEIIDAQVLTVTMADFGDAMAQTIYRFYLRDDKIFRVDILPGVMAEVPPVSLDRIPAAEKVVLSYIGAVEKQDYALAMRHLAASARQNHFKPTPVPSPAWDFDNISVRTVGSTGSTAYIESVHTFEGFVIVTNFYTLRNIQGAWLIEEITLVSEEPAATGR